MPLWLAELRLELLLLRRGLDFRWLPLLERELLERPLELVLRPLALLERDALLWPPSAGFERDALPDAAVERLRDEAPPELRLALVFEPEPLDEPRVPCPLLEVGLVGIHAPF